MSFLDIARPLIDRNLPVIPLRPRSKIALLDGWPELATTDLSQIEKWNNEYPEANVGCVSLAKPDGIWIWEVDSPEAIQRFEKDTGKKLPKTFRVRSRPGRGHIFFKQSPDSLKMGNLTQAFVKESDWSARVDRQYCVGAGSLHPATGKVYEIISDVSIVEAPKELIDWLQSQKVEKKDVFTTANDNAPIPSGSRNASLASHAGRLRNAGVEQEELEMILLRINRERCSPPLDESEVKTIAASISRYPVGKDTTILVGGKDPRLEIETAVSEESEYTSEFIVPPYPVFPKWVMSQTSVYENFVRPYCSLNSRYEEFLFMPAVLLFLNYLGTKIRIQNKDIIPSLYLGLIGKKGRVIKSSSVQDAINYFRYAGIVDHADSNTRNAEGKTLIFTAGSPEGLGIELQRTACHNSVLFYDELSVLTSKSGIESSTLVPALLTLYESGKFSNAIKSKKESYSLAPNSYCNSLIFCCTDKNFNTLWGKMSGVTSGLNDRFFFLLQPEKLKDVTPPVAVNTAEGALETRKLIDRAVMQGVYRIVDSSPLAARMNGDNKLENRQEIRAEKFALFFAIDMGKDEIDEDCIERGLALVEYEQAVKRKLRPSESVTREAQVQNDLVDFLLSQPNGKTTYREVLRALHPERLGTTLWGTSFQGLIKAGQIMVQGKGTKTDPKTVTLLHAPEESDD